MCEVVEDDAEGIGKNEGRNRQFSRRVGGAIHVILDRVVHSVCLFGEKLPFFRLNSGDMTIVRKKPLEVFSKSTIHRARKLLNGLKSVFMLKMF